MKLSTIPAKLWFGGAVALAAAIAAAQLDGRFVAAQEAEPPAAAAALDGSRAVSSDTQKDVEVMRRVLVREALGARVGDARNAFYGVAGQGGAYQSLAAPGDALLVPGQGATFVLRTADPVAPPPGSTGSSEQVPASAWDEEAAALSLGGAAHDGKARASDGVWVTSFSRFSSGYDAEKVGALRDRIVEQLALFGNRIRGLAPTDRVSVVVLGGAAGTRAVALGSESGTTPNTRPPAAGGAERSSQGGASGATTQSMPPFAGRLVVLGGGPATTMTISVSVADCDAAAKGTLSRDEFRRRAVVSQY